MAAVNSNMFNASIAIDRPQGASLLVLPLNLIAQIVACVRTHLDITFPRVFSFVRDERN
jgi:hypothetical protein